MRTKQSIYNALSALILQLVNLGVVFILPRVIIGEYGSEINGLIMNIRTLVVQLAIVEAGIAGASIFALYEPLASKDNKVINGILSATSKFYNLSGYIFTGLLIGSAVVYALVLQDQGIMPYMIAGLIIIIGMSGILDFFVVGKYKVLLTADQKSYIISLIQSIATILNAVIIVVLALRQVNILIVQAVAVTSFLLRAYLYYVYCHKKYGFIDFHEKEATQKLNKRWDVLFLNILGTITILVPVQIVTFFMGLKETSVYTTYNLVFSGVYALIATFSTGLSAAFGDMLARKEKDRFQKAYSQYEFVYYIILGTAYATAAILIMPFIRVYTATFDDANYIRPIVGYLFALTGLLFNLKSPQGMIVISAGLYRETRQATAIQALITLFASLIFAYFLGMPGVLLGGIAASVYRSIELGFYIPRTVSKLPVSQTFKRMIRTVILFFIVAFIPMQFFALDANTYGEWLLVAILCGLYSLVAFLVTNILFERKTAKEVYFRMKLLLEELK